MGQHTKLIVTLCLGQAICLAFGLWLRGRIEHAINDAYTGAVESAEVQSPDAWGRTAAIEAIAFVWITGLQSAAIFLTMQRIGEIDNKNLINQDEQTLLAAKELVRTRDAIIFGLAKLAESRDPETGQHLERISLYSMKLASKLRHHPTYRNEVTSSFVKMIGISSVLHDIGKVGVEDSVLLKPGPLTESERFRIQVHTRLGGDCIHQIERRLGNSEFLRMAKDIALCHHEQWDGTGYPRGLKGLQIPLSARIVSIADVYDALSTKRVYKDAYSHEVCVSKIRDGSGTQFDPELIKVFLSIEAEFELIAKRYRDTHETDPNAMSPSQEELLQQVLGQECDAGDEFLGTDTLRFSKIS